jgi:hypothetical protein
MKSLTKSLILLSLVCFTVSTTTAQSQDGPVAHMSYLADREAELQKNYLNYMSEVAHGQRARKMEKKRQELIVSIQQAIRDGGKLRPYQGDVSLRTAYVEYWNILLNIFKEDYHKIVDMEEVAEQSYDAMEAMMLAQQKVDEKLGEAYDKIPPAYEAFAEKHHVTLTKGEDSKISKKLGKVGQVNGYVNKLFLIYFKSAVQENNLAAAMNAKDINAAEQSKNALALYAKEGLAKLDTTKAFNNDQSLINACRKALEFHKAEAETRAQPLIDFILKADEFTKIKKSFDAKPASKRTQADVDDFNKKVAELNKGAENFNKQSQQLFKDRVNGVEGWNNARKNFMDRHMPYK